MRVCLCFVIGFNGVLGKFLKGVVSRAESGLGNTNDVPDGDVFSQRKCYNSCLLAASLLINAIGHFRVTKIMAQSEDLEGVND